jgi:hypothetical protein
LKVVLAEAVLQELRRIRLIPANTIQVDLSQGWVMLMSIVDCDSQIACVYEVMRAVWTGQLTQQGWAGTMGLKKEDSVVTNIAPFGGQRPQIYLRAK